MPHHGQKLAAPSLSIVLVLAREPRALKPKPRAKCRLHPRMCSSTRPQRMVRLPLPFPLALLPPACGCCSHSGVSRMSRRPLLFRASLCSPHPRSPLPGFLCPLEANVWDVEFLAFKIRDAEAGTVRRGWPSRPPLLSRFHLDSPLRLPRRRSAHASEFSAPTCACLRPRNHRCTLRCQSQSQTARVSTGASWMTPCGSFSTPFQRRCCR
jgi:hypothetical protein